MLKPICVKCQRFYRAKKNGYRFIEGMPIAGNERPKPGTAEPGQWEPYKLWVGDLYECGGCGNQLVTGVAREPLAEHYMPDFAEKVALEVARRGEPLVQVNDC